MKKIIYFAFLGIITILPNLSYADDLDFYSRIDDAGDSLIQNITKKKLDDFSSFKNFGTNCRKPISWLDNAPMNQKILDEISVGGFGELAKLASDAKANITTDELVDLSSCLKSTYDTVKSSSITEKDILEDAGSVGIFMDGDLENSDFDIIADINKINEIIFSKPVKYEGSKNATKNALDKYLKGIDPVGLGVTAKEIKDNPSIKNGNTNNNFGSGSENNSENQNNLNNETSLPWLGICHNESNSSSVSGVNNMVDKDFLRDLNSALRGGNNHNNGIDYGSKNNTNSTNNSILDDTGLSEKNSTSADDFATKLPCNSFFCIKVGSSISNENLLAGGNSYAIETILDKHIKITNPLSWGSLAGQKMTNNSFQIPFLNIKFSTQIAGGAVFTHNSPQVTKIKKTTEESLEMNFDELQKCAWSEAGLSTDMEKNNGIIGGGFEYNPAHNTENFSNATKPLDPIEAQKFAGCSTVVQNSAESKYHNGFSTQVNELQAFTSAILDVIEQILQAEQRLDTVKVQ